MKNSNTQNLMKFTQTYAATNAIPATTDHKKYIYDDCEKKNLVKIGVLFQ